MSKKGGNPHIAYKVVEPTRSDVSKNKKYLKQYYKIRNASFLGPDSPYNNKADEYDRRSTHILAIINGKVVGGARVVLGYRKFQIPMEEYLGKAIDKIFPALSIKQGGAPVCAEVGGLCVSKDGERQGIGTELFRRSFVYAKEKDISIVVSRAKPVSSEIMRVAAQQVFSRDVAITEPILLGDGMKERTVMIAAIGKRVFLNLPKLLSRAIGAALRGDSFPNPKVIKPTCPNELLSKDTFSISK